MSTCDCLMEKQRMDVAQKLFMYECFVDVYSPFFLVLIDSSKDHEQDNCDFGRIFDSIAFIQMANDLQILLYCLC